MSDIKAIVAELAELRKELETMAGKHKAACNNVLEAIALRKEAREERDAAQWNITQQGKQLAELRKERDELREAVLGLGELEPKGEMWITDSLRYATWNALVAKLRAEKETEP